jgi:hypothetical protein
MIVCFIENETCLLDNEDLRVCSAAAPAAFIHDAVEFSISGPHVQIDGAISYNTPQAGNVM